MRATALVLLAVVTVILAAPAVVVAENDAFNEYVEKNNITLITILNSTAENCTEMSCPCKKPELPDLPQNATFWEKIKSLPSRVEYYFSLIGYYFCLLKESAKHLLQVIGEGFGMIVGYLKSLFYAVVVFGKGALTALLFFVNIAVLAAKTIASWGVNITGWLPYILMTALVISFADAMNRMYRSKSIFPLQQMVSAWKSFFGLIISFFEKIWERLKDLIDLVSRIIEALKPW